MAVNLRARRIYVYVYVCSIVAANKLTNFISLYHVCLRLQMLDKYSFNNNELENVTFLG